MSVAAGRTPDHRPAAEPPDQTACWSLVTVATSTPLPADQEDEDSDEEGGAGRMGGVGGWGGAGGNYRQTAAANWPTLATGSLKGSA